jgi:hypothetical protein
MDLGILLAADEVLKRPMALFFHLKALYCHVINKTDAVSAERLKSVKEFFRSKSYCKEV